MQQHQSPGESHGWCCGDVKGLAPVGGVEMEMRALAGIRMGILHLSVHICLITHTV